MRSNFETAALLFYKGVDHIIAAQAILKKEDGMLPSTLVRMEDNEHIEKWRKFFHEGVHGPSASSEPSPA